MVLVSKPAQTLIVAVVAAATIAGAQDRPQTGRVFTDTLRVDVVNVEVVVVDRRGRPVYGLERDDFELLVNGDKVEISNFWAPPAPDQVPEQPGPVAFEAIEMEAPPRHIVVFVDHTNLLPARRPEVMASLKKLIEERLAEGDRVMIAAYDAQVDVLSEFGDDLETHLAALEAVDRSGASTFDSQAEFNRILRCMETSCNEPEFIFDEVKIYARHLRHRSRILLAHLESVIESMAGLPGRRSLLMVSDGIPARPGESLFAIYQRRYSGQDGGMRYQFEANRYRLTGDLEELTDLANARRVTLYALNNGGIVGNTLSSSSSAVSATQMVDQEIDFVRDANYSASMQQLTLSTGGRVVLQPTDETLDEVGQDFDAAYSLGFTPDHAPDDRSRSITVRVLREGLKVRYRDNYRLTTDEGSAAVLTKIAMILGETDNPLDISVEFAPNAEKAGRRRVVHAAVRIPIDPLTMLPVGSDVHQGRLEFTFYLEDDEGASTPIQQSELPFELPGEAVASSTPIHITYNVGFKVRPGDHRLALTVTDALGSKSSTLTWSLAVGEDGRVMAANR